MGVATPLREEKERKLFFCVIYGTFITPTARDVYP